MSRSGTNGTAGTPSSMGSEKHRKSSDR
jgi:hypothetical protein